MNNDLISRSALLETLRFAEEHGNGFGLAFPIELVEVAPAIDPESLRPKGRWERECGDLHSSGVLYYCSECGKRHFVNFKHSLPSLQVSEELFSKPNYCPNCGADMRGGK